VIPNDVPRMDKQLYQKTDKIDCRNLCKQLQKDQLHGIYIPSEAEDQFKSLFAPKEPVSKTVTKSKITYKGYVTLPWSCCL
jgi:hypothetical protein